MLDVLIATVPPAPPPFVRAVPFHRTRHVLTMMRDGSTWDLTDWRRGVFLTKDGIVGMDDPEWDIRSLESPIAHGSRYFGARAPAREVALPIYLFAKSSAEWHRLYRAFKRQLSPDYPVLWQVEPTDDPSSRRSLLMRYVGTSTGTSNEDHRWRGWKRMTLRFVADERPFWEGTPVVQPWSTEEAKPFLDPAGSPPLHLSSGAVLGSATMRNPGDEPAYPTWEIFGPCESVTVGVGGRLVVAPIALGPNESLRIETGGGPHGKSAYDNHGVRRTPELTVRDFAPIPPGEEVPVSLAMIGAGSVKCTLVPVYHEAL